MPVTMGTAKTTDAQATPIPPKPVKAVPEPTMLEPVTVIPMQHPWQKAS